VTCSCSAVTVNLQLFIGTGRVELRCDSCLRIFGYDEWLGRRNPSAHPSTIRKAVPGDAPSNFFQDWGPILFVSFVSLAVVFALLVA